ncbi:MFS transporter [Craterilacuibacter sp.]|uniref:MFS transporter n=1 Tax=Craterilacuibacter sp. TaxID=2870909 RepID=UPI003F3F0C54
MLTTRALLLAGLPGLPLAMAALPVYVFTPMLYAGEYGMPLALVGALLFGARLLDTAQDPLLGILQDRLPAKTLPIVTLLMLALGLAGFFWLLLPFSGFSLAWQMAASLLLVYTAHGWISIALYRYSAALSRQPKERERIVAWREGLSVAGVLLAAALPAMLSARYGIKTGLAGFAALLVVASLLALWAFNHAPSAPPTTPEQQDWRIVLGDQRFLALLLVLLLNAMAMALPATLFNFYVADVLRAPDLAGAFLLSYFLCAAASLPLWLMLATRLGKVRAWYVGMALALAGFALVPWLTEDNRAAFWLVCIATGTALGADLAYSTAMVADIIGDRVKSAGGAYFGAVSLVGKLALALAAGTALPLAALAGYAPGNSANTGALILLYAGLPCAVKLMAWFWLARLRPQLEANS